MRSTVTGAPGARPSPSIHVVSRSGLTRDSGTAGVFHHPHRVRLRRVHEPSPRTATKGRRRKMSLTRLLPAWFHAIADYAVGTLLIIVALASGVGGAAEATGIVVGATVL